MRIQSSTNNLILSNADIKAEGKLSATTYQPLMITLKQN